MKIAKRRQRKTPVVAAEGASVCKACLAEGITEAKATFSDAGDYDAHLSKKH